MSQSSFDDEVVNHFNGLWRGQEDFMSEISEESEDIELTPIRDRPRPFIISPFTQRMPADRRPNGAKNWCFTWNNYPANAVETIVTTFEGFTGCHAWCFQHEDGENETPHIQGCVQFTRKIRWTQLELPDAIHWEACRGSWQQNVNYCSKRETRDLTKGPPVTHNCHPTEIVRVLEEAAFHPWQQKVYNLLQGPVNDRHIYWLWDAAGNIGKSSFVKKMVVDHDAIFCAGSRTTDIINLTYNAFEAGRPIKIILWDLSRSSRGRISFDAVEMLKNGLIANMKYETGIAAFNPPHIIVFANDEPVRIDAISADRWRIYEIVDLDVDL